MSFYCYLSFGVIFFSFIFLSLHRQYCRKLFWRSHPVWEPKRQIHKIGSTKWLYISILMNTTRPFFLDQTWLWGSSGEVTASLIICVSLFLLTVCWSWRPTSSENDHTIDSYELTYIASIQIVKTTSSTSLWVLALANSGRIESRTTSRFIFTPLRTTLPLQISIYERQKGNWNIIQRRRNQNSDPVLQRSSQK